MQCFRSYGNSKSAANSMHTKFSSKYANTNSNENWIEESVLDFLVVACSGVFFLTLHRSCNMSHQRGDTAG